MHTCPYEGGVKQGYYSNLITNLTVDIAVVDTSLEDDLKYTGMLYLTLAH